MCRVSCRDKWSLGAIAPSFPQAVPASLVVAAGSSVEGVDEGESSPFLKELPLGWER